MGRAPLLLCAATTPWRPSWIPFTKPTLLLWNFKGPKCPKTALKSAKKWWKGQILTRSVQWYEANRKQNQNKKENGGGKIRRISSERAPPSSPFSRWKWTRPEVLGDFERANKQQLGNTDRFFNVWGRGRQTPQPFWRKIPSKHRNGQFWWFLTFRKKISSKFVYIQAA